MEISQPSNTSESKSQKIDNNSNDKELGQEEKWDLVISPKKPLFELQLNQIWNYRDLMFIFVHRDVTSVYKQTILGPLWFFVQPFITTVMFTFIFSNLAGISTDGVPPLLFYLAGITNWNFFAECLNKASNTFVINQHIFGKVYFPRLIVPLAQVITNLVKYGIQLLLFLGFYIYFILNGSTIFPNSIAFLFPILVLILAGLGLGFGLLFTSMTTKYKDLSFLLTFGVQLAMYATPVIYPLSEVPQNYQWLSVLNPMTAIIETFKYGFLGKGTFSWANLAYSCSFMIVLFLLSLAVFNRTEKNFIDTI